MRGSNMTLYRPPTIAKPIPMKRELKLSSPAANDIDNSIAKPIPMKRELKLITLAGIYALITKLQSLSR